MLEDSFPDSLVDAELFMCKKGKPGAGSFFFKADEVLGELMCSSYMFECVGSTLQKAELKVITVACVPSSHRDLKVLSCYHFSPPKCDCANSLLLADIE